MTSDLSRHVCGQNVCDVQAAVLCCAVAAEAPKNLKKILEEKRTIKGSGVSHQTAAACSRIPPLHQCFHNQFAVSSVPHPCSALHRSINRCPNPAASFACLCLIRPAALPPLQPNIRTTGPATLCARCPSIQVPPPSVSQASAAAFFGQHYKSSTPPPPSHPLAAKPLVRHHTRAFPQAPPSPPRHPSQSIRIEKWAGDVLQPFQKFHTLSMLRRPSCVTLSISRW